MKKIVLVFISLALLASCGNRYSARRTAKAFLQSHYIERDFEAVKRLSTEASLPALEQNYLLYERNPFAEEDQAVERFKIVSVEAQKTKAVCIYEIQGQQKRLNLNKVNGVWLVHMPETQFFDPGASLNAPTQTGGMTSAESAPTRISDLRKQQEAETAGQ